LVVVAAAAEESSLVPQPIGLALAGPARVTLRPPRKRRRVTRVFRISTEASSDTSMEGDVGAMGAPRLQVMIRLDQSWIGPPV